MREGGYGGLPREDVTSERAAVGAGAGVSVKLKGTARGARTRKIAEGPRSSRGYGYFPCPGEHVGHKN